MVKRIYLDYASLTPIDPRVSREMKRYSSAEYANPASLYKEGVAAKKALEEGRKRAGEFIHAHAGEIVFTSGGTEANNLALEGVLKAAHKNGIARPHLIVSNIEHSSIMEDAVIAERVGVEVTRLTVDSNGLISLDELKKAIKPNTVLVSIMTVNNEIGTVQPIREIAKTIRWARANITKSNAYPLFHTDAAQAALYCDLNVEQLGVDLLTLDASKAYGPRSIGCLYVRRDTPIEPIVHGGGQERGMRSGTENVPAIMGFAKALEIAASERDGEVERISQLRERFLTGLLRIRPNLKVNPDLNLSGGATIPPNRYTRYDITPGEDMSSASLLKSVEKVDTFANLSKGPSLSGGHLFHDQQASSYSSAMLQSPHILNVSIPGIDNELFVLRLDAHGVAASTKSSCLRDAEESYVLKAIGADSGTAVRFSFGRSTKKPDIARALAAIAKALKV